MKGRRQQATRKYNLGLILTLIRQEVHVSRAELARLSRLTKPVIASIVETLMENKLVIELSKGEISIGRRPMLLALDLSYYRFVGVNLSRKYIQLVVTNLAGEVCHSEEHPWDNDIIQSGDQFLLFLETIIANANVESKRILGIGVAHPFPFHLGKKWVIGPSRKPDWEGIDVVAFLEECFDVPVLADNDANIVTLFEKGNGSAKDFEDFVYVMIGEGVGAGVFSGGRLLRGSQGFAGEFGHTSLANGDRPCQCGKTGCLETVISLSAVKSGMASLLDVSPADVTPDLIEGHLHNESVLQYINHYRSVMALHIGNLVNLCNPQAIIIGGQISAYSKVLLDRIGDELERYVHPLMGGSYEVILNGGLEDSVVRGAAVAVEQRFFRKPYEYMEFHRQQLYPDNAVY